MKNSPEFEAFASAMRFRDELHKNFYITPRDNKPLYLDRKLSKQGLLIREATAQRPDLFQHFQDEEVQDNFCKSFLQYFAKTTSVSTSSAGGQYLISEPILPELLLLARNRSIALKYCKIHRMKQNILHVPKEATKVEVAWIDEGGSVIAGNSTFDEVKLQTRDVTTLTGKKIAVMVTVSNELLQDTSIDLVSTLLELFLDAMSQELDNQLFNGDGALVSGILTAASAHSVVLSGSAFSTITSTDISSAISKLEEGYLQKARFVVGRTQAHYLRNVKDSGLRPIFLNSNAGAPGTGEAYGFPAEVAEKISTADGSSAPFGVFGNFEKFLLGQRDDRAVIKSDPYMLAQLNQTRFLFTSRWGFGYGDNGAFCRIMNA